MRRSVQHQKARTSKGLLQDEGVEIQSERKAPRRNNLPFPHPIFRAIFGRSSCAKSSTYLEYACGFVHSGPAEPDPNLGADSVNLLRRGA